MKYMGSKNKLSKYIVPIIQDYIDKNNIKNYIEPFVGGANIIDKIKCKKKIGCDVHTELIHLLKYVQNEDNLKNLSDYISKEEYDLVREDSKKPIKDRKYPLWYIGFVGFISSYNGRYFDGGYSGIRKTKGGERNYTLEAKNNLINQSSKEEFKNIFFDYCSFLDTPKLQEYVIYCDPPYRNTKQYNVSKNFPYDEFYEWCVEMSKDNIVLISEYDMPEDKFKCIWEKEHSTHMNQKKDKKVEKLFIVKK